MSPLTGVLALLAATTAAGPVLVAAFSLGLYGWPSVILALALGAFAAAALAGPIESEIKRQDPAWDEARDRARPVPVRRSGPERGAPPGARRDWRR